MFIMYSSHGKTNNGPNITIEYPTINIGISGNLCFASSICCMTSFTRKLMSLTWALAPSL